MRELELSIKEDERVAFPESDYELGITALRHRIAQGPGDAHARSMVTANVLVFEKGELVHQELVADGEAAWFRDLEIRLLGAHDDLAQLKILRAPFSSIPPRPA